ncbi:MAG: hypothetical protein MZV70_61460 [Desulfobacterales bacterium]|nr:hypothetical protein [Desulfobacterales bacterium]
MKDYCQYLEIPEVVDPSDQVGVTDDFWNIPVLIDSGVTAQLAEPWLVMKASIAVDFGPFGLIPEMASHYPHPARWSSTTTAAASGCAQPDPSRPLQLRRAPPTRTAAGSSTGHRPGGIAHPGPGGGDQPTSRPTSWTPLAEALYNAICSYYTQSSALRLNGRGFPSRLRLRPGERLVPEQQHPADHRRAARRPT